MQQPSSYHQSRPLFTAPLGALIQLERNSGVPLYRQICQKLREAILSGELAEGVRLPTERALANELGVNRTTVMNAYNELASEGLVEGHVGRGTLIRRNHFSYENEHFEHEASWLLGLPTGERELLGPDAGLLSELASAGEHKGVISLAPGTPPHGLLPAEMLLSIFTEGLLNARQSALGYCPVEGLSSLRREIAAYMRKRGVPVDAQHILILSGSTQGIGLTGRFLLNPGDEVVVEVPTYLGAIQSFRALGARIIGVPTDSDGMRVDLLESILTRHRPRLIYTLPTFQNPTGVVMSPERRRRLLLLAKRYQTPILEDDPYSEIYFEGKQPQPLKALDTSGQQVLYLSTYSKILAPGLRVAWLAAPEPLIERLSLHKQVFDLNTNAIGQWAVSEILQRDLLNDHLIMLRQHYQHKRDLMLQAINVHWPKEVRVNRPDGGFHLWCRLPGDIRARTLLREVAQEQVAFVIGEPFHVDGGGQQQFRLSFAYPEEEHIEEGVRRIGNAIKRLLARRPPREDLRGRHVEHVPMV